MNTKPDPSDRNPFPKSRKDYALWFLAMEAIGRKMGIPFDAEVEFRRNAQLEARQRRAELRRFWKLFTVAFIAWTVLVVAIVRIHGMPEGESWWREIGLMAVINPMVAAAFAFILPFILGLPPADDDGPGPGPGPRPEPVSPRDGNSKPQPVAPVHH